MNSIAILSLLLLAAFGIAGFYYLRMQFYKRSCEKRILFPMQELCPDKKRTDNRHKFENLAYKMGLIVNSGKIGLWEYDVKKNRFSYLNNNNPFFDGYTWERYLQFVHPDDRDIPSEALRSLINNETDILQISYRFKTPCDENYRWFELTAVIGEREQNGKPGLLLGLRWDITVSVQERLLLKDAKALLELTFMAAEIIPWEFDLATQKMSSNNEFSVFYREDYTISEYITKFVHPDHREIFTKEIDNILNKGQEILNLKVLTYYNEKYEWTLIVGKVMCDLHTKVSKAIGTSHFITADVEREQELITLRQKAEEATRLQSAFFANITHEIRTSLNSIVGFSSLITQTNDPEESKEYCRIIESNNELLLQLVNDILDISKIEAGQMEFNFKDFDLCEVFTTLKQLYAHKITDRVELICNLPDKSFFIYMDKKRLIQILSNLLSNAIKFTSEGSITIGYEWAKDGIRFYVCDTGKGIEKEDLSRIFERFTKIDSSAQGTGLGLAICKILTEKLGGVIGVISEPGRGSEFWFTIPSKRA